MRELDTGDTLDGFRIEARLARGGMATVFRAVELASGSPVALKVPHLWFESDVVFHERFRREEEVALRLDHPGVVRALPVPGEKSRMYLVLEWVDGTPLSALLADGRSLPVARALDVARQICDVLAYLHAQGVVHRDLKPGNVLITRTGQVRILDLGLAHVEGARRLTIPGLSTPSGTPAYMAPEQMRGRTGDARVDVYALGIMLYEMLAGRLPYASEDWNALVRAKRLDAPTPPDIHVPGLDRGLAAIVMKAIEADPADRYATAVDMLAELRDPAAVRPHPGLVARAALPRRVDAGRLAALVAVLAALCTIGGTAWLAHRRVAESGAGKEPSAEALRGPPGSAR